MSSPLDVSERLVRRYLDYVHEHAPVEATRIGLTDRDGELPDLSPEAIDHRLRDLAGLRSEVGAAATDLASRPVRDDSSRSSASEVSRAGDDTADALATHEALADLRLLAEELDYRMFVLGDRMRYSHDPRAAVEAVAASVHELLRRTHLDRDECHRRLAAAVQRAHAVPHLLEQAGSLLESSPAPHLELALRRIPDVIALFADGLPQRASMLGGDVAASRAAAASAVEGLEAFAALLSELEEEPAADWRYGPSGHATVLTNALGTSMHTGDIYARARAWRDEVRDEMVELASQGWQRRFPGEALPSDPTERIRRTLSSIADTAVAADEFVSEALCAVEEARRFALEAGLTDVPPAQRLDIEEIPGYLAGIAVAFIAPPPVLDPDAGCTFYLSPVPERADEVQRRTFLREYHPSQLRALAIHETYPGHFVQLEHASRHPRLARRLLTRPVFAEGWAVYIEREAIRHGFPHACGSTINADDYRFTHAKLELRVATNAMLDVGLHSGDLDDPGALQLLADGAFQSEGEAASKLVRAKVSAGQLSTYFVGAEELRDLRREVEQRDGAAFNLRAFHQQVLSHGTPTVEIIADALSAQAPTLRPFAVGAA